MALKYLSLSVQPTIVFRMLGKESVAIRSEVQYIKIHCGLLCSEDNRPVY